MRNLTIILMLLPFIISCSKEDRLCLDSGVVPTSPYNSPAWHPSGKIIGFNHTPIKGVTYRTEKDCGTEANYTYKEDSVGFWLINSDGTNKRRILPYELLNPVWSYDGEWIAFWAGQIVIMPFDGEKFDTTNIVQLKSEGRNFFHAWSRDGKNIAYSRSICEGKNTCGIWVYNLSSNTQRFIADYGGFPSWYDNDSFLFSTNAYSSSKDVGDSLWTFSLSTGKKQFLKFIGSPNYENRYFKYSTDGEKIAFISQYDTGEGVHLCIINNDGSGFKKLTTNTKGATAFSWSPDNRIVYLADDNNSISETLGTLWIMDADGNNQKQLTFNNALKTK